MLCMFQVMHSAPSRLALGSDLSPDRHRRVASELHVLVAYGEVSPTGPDRRRRGMLRRPGVSDAFQIVRHRIVCNTKVGMPQLAVQVYPGIPDSTSSTLA